MRRIAPDVEATELAKKLETITDEAVLRTIGESLSRRSTIQYPESPREFEAPGSTRGEVTCPVPVQGILSLDASQPTEPLLEAGSGSPSPAKSQHSAADEQATSVVK